MMEKLLTDRTSQNNRPFCGNCQKRGHFVGNCFTLRKCFNCNEKSHIAKNCKKMHSAPTTVNSLDGLTKEHLEPQHRTLIKVRESDKPVSFLYVTGSQHKIITRKTYDSLPNKPLLSPFSSSRIGVDGHTFCFDGIVLEAVARRCSVKCYSDLSHLPNSFDKEKLKTILIDYYDKIRDKNVSESTIPYEHAIQLYDDTPVKSKPRTVPYAYQS